MRDHAPSNQDGEYGYEPDEVSNFSEPSRTGGGMPSETARKLARESWSASTTWLNASRRGAWNNSIRAFNSQHPSGSKYNSGAYQHRSALFRPKTRAMVRRDEAATAAAFFSNEDVVSISAADDDDPMQQASAELLQELLQFRLTKTIPWFLTLVGARQDCDVQGVCAVKLYWKYEERVIRTERRVKVDDQGMLEVNPDGTVSDEVIEILEKLHDKPVLDMLAPENLRFDAGADWRDPIGTSPFVIEAVPMYVQDVRAKIDSGEWLPISESALMASADTDNDATRRTREAGRTPGKDDDGGNKPRAFGTCWVHHNIIRWEEEDWVFYTIASTGDLLTDPVPLKDVYLHGMRPYVLGSVIVETHKTYPASKVELTRDLQWASNDDWNMRFDNLKLNLNPRQFVKAGDATDIADLRSFVPGKVVMVKNPGDVVWDRPPPPGAEAYAEQDRINLDFDELTGAFSNSSVQASQVNEQSATGMHLMSGEASGIVEYEQRVFAETFVEPVLRMLIKLEQAYETDPIVLSLAGKKAQLLTKYGVNAITDELLNQEVTTKVNVGIGATNPRMKLQQFAMAGQMMAQLYGPMLIPGLNFEEVAKEIFSLSGYKDGGRFIKPNYDPAQQQQGAAPKGGQNDQVKLQVAQITTQGKLEEAKVKGQIESQKAQLDLQAQRENDQAENFRAMLSAQRQQMPMMQRQAMQAPHPALAGLRG